MLRSIVEASLKSRFVVLVIATALLVVGVSRLREMPVDVLPEFSLPYVEIQTEALGLSAEEVEQLVTLGMEQDLLNGVPWVQSIRSESLPGLNPRRSEEHTSELSHQIISYAVFCLKKKKNKNIIHQPDQ